MEWIKSIEGVDFKNSHDVKAEPFYTFYTVFQKKEKDTKLMAVTLSFLNRFSKFFH